MKKGEGRPGIGQKVALFRPKGYFFCGSSDGKMKMDHYPYIGGVCPFSGVDRPDGRMVRKQNRQDEAIYYRKIIKIVPWQQGPVLVKYNKYNRREIHTFSM